MTKGLSARAAVWGILCLALVACAGPVGTTRVDHKVVLRELDQSAITSGEPSMQTRNVLYERGLFEAFGERPEAAITELHRMMVAAQGDEDMLFALAELSFLHGQASKKRDYYLGGSRLRLRLPLPRKDRGCWPGAV